MKLKNKVFLILIILFSLIIFSEFLILRIIVYPAFIQLEEQEASDNITRIINALENEIINLDILCNDWATWNNTYDFIHSRSEEYINSNLQHLTFHETSLNVIYLINTEREVVWGETFDIDQDKEIFVREIPLEYFPEDHPLLDINLSSNDLSEEKLTGLYNTDKGPLLIAVEPILTSNAEGPPRGYLMMGFFINEKIIQNIEQQTKTKFDITYLYNHMNIESDPVMEGLKESPFYVEKDRKENIYNLYSYFFDIQEKPSLLIQTVFLRNISIQGKRIISYAAISLIFTGIIVLFFVILSLNKFILHPLYLLKKIIIKIQETKDYSLRLDFERKDEIGELADAFDFFINKVQAWRELEDFKTDIEGIIRHDLKTPLNSIIGFPPMMLTDDTLSHTNKEYLKIILTSGQNMMNLINASLNLYKLEEGNYQFNLVETDILAILRQINIEMRDISNRKENTIQFHLMGEQIDSDSSLIIKTEKSFLYMILTNIIKNALEASPPGENVTVNINRDENLLISVHNKGGIPEEIRERFFKKYVTLNKKHGNGLGTYSAKLMAIAIDADLYFKTSEEDGTTLYLSFIND